MSLRFFVAGKPVAQGSKKHVGNGRMVEMGKGLGPWRESIRWAAMQAGRVGPVGLVRYAEGPMSVNLEFVMPRPTSTPKTKPTPPAVKRPDLDKLIRAVLDALSSAGTWKDDSQVVQVLASKRIAETDETTGVHIYVAPMSGDASAE